MSNQNAEQVHRLFRGATEAAKWAATGALVIESVAASIAGWRVLCPPVVWSGWASLLLVTILVIGIVAKLWARSVYGFGERCRRVAMSAYAFGRAVPGALTTSLIADAPAATEMLAAKLPTQDLNEYYEATEPPGFGRLREIYAHSAFYSWRLLCVCWRIYAVVATIFAAMGFFVIYTLATGRYAVSVADRVLDFVCSVVVVFFVARAVDAFVGAWSSAQECKRIADEVLVASDDRTRELSTDYDVERAAGRTIPTLVYRRMRDQLQVEWLIRRQDLRA